MDLKENAILKINKTQDAINIQEVVDSLTSYLCSSRTRAFHEVKSALNYASPKYHVIDDDDDEDDDDDGNV